jgi:hypothetical protein
MFCITDYFLENSFIGQKPYIRQKSSFTAEPLYAEDATALAYKYQLRYVNRSESDQILYKTADWLKKAR